MLNAIRSAKNKAPPTALLFPYHSGSRTSPSGLIVRFRQAASGTNQPQNVDNMEQQQQQQQQKQQPHHHTGDVMSHSFGEGYATRADEEGFGGTNTGSDAAAKIQQDKFIHENHPAYDKTQGSEVAEKEKGRHQKTAA